MYHFCQYDFELSSFTVTSNFNKAVIYFIERRFYLLVLPV